MLASITYQINTLKYLPTQKNSPKPPNHTNVVRNNRRAPPLDGGKSMKFGGMWNLKLDIISPRSYEVFVKK